MKKIISHLFLTWLLTISFTLQADDASVNAEISRQAEACRKNTAREWSVKLNRCIGKQEAIDTRNSSKACNEISDMKARERCHLDLAEKSTKLNSDPNSLSQGNLGKSAIMNGVGTAYTILGMINGIGSGKKASKCMSKKIFGITAMAGTATDIWLKIRAKKKMDSLAGKYKLEKTQNPYDAQVKALYYLKEEQETVADIADAEKKRNMLLTLGYGAATAMAIYEMATYVTSSHCYIKDSDAKPADDSKVDKQTVVATADPAPATEAVSKPVTGRETPITTTELPKLDPAPAPAPVAEVVVAPTPAPTPAPVPAPTPTPTPPANPDYRFADPSKKGSYDPSVYDRAQEMLRKNGLKRSDLDDNRLQKLYDNSQAYQKVKLFYNEIIMDLSTKELSLRGSKC